jgi:hypothetical protein
MARTKTTDMKRVNLYLTTRQWDSLEKLAEGFGISISEYLRRLIDEHLASKRSEKG